MKTMRSREFTSEKMSTIFQQEQTEITEAESARSVFLCKLTAKE